MVKEVLPRMTILASGGLRDGIDIAKCIALGATAGGIAGPFLKTAAISLESSIQSIEAVKLQIKIAMFACGAKDVEALSKAETIPVEPVHDSNA
jgi:isopentenyl-diphosphate delta-isomerase